MKDAGLAIVALIAGSGGAAWGARSCGADGWRGALIVAVSGGVISILVAATGVENSWLWIACNLLLAAITGKVLKLTFRQTAITMATSVLTVIIAALIYTFVFHGNSR